MSQTETANTRVKSVNPQYLRLLLEYNHFTVIDSPGTTHQVESFTNYNHVVAINQIFSTWPSFDIVDRTGVANGPIIFAPVRPWAIPKTQISLESALQQRVAEICNRGQRINLFWSGGIDSTTIVTAFIKYAPDLKQCRVCYSPWSTYEHPNFYKKLQAISELELLDLSGTTYLNLNLDGLMISGNSGDEIHASMDQSFLDQYGYETLHSSWKDFFYSKKPHCDFIEFCESWFAQAGREIFSVLDARWWFYAITKLTSLLFLRDLQMHNYGNGQFNAQRLLGFFDCDQYEQYIYFNVDKIIPSKNYSSWKQSLKDFCFSFDRDEDYRVYKTKTHSQQVVIYGDRKQILNDTRHLMFLDNGTKVSTPNLPLFSRKEWYKIKDQYNHLFRFWKNV